MDRDFHHVLFPVVRFNDCDGRRVGGAVPWLIFVVVVLGLLGALALWGPGRGGSESIDPLVDGVVSGSSKDITDELEKLGDLLIQAGENKRDIGPLLGRVEKLIVEQPESVEAHTLHAQMLLEAGRPGDALGAFQAALKIEPRQARVHQMAGDLAMNLEMFEDARHHYEQALSIEPGSGRYAVSLANLQFKVREDAEATETLLTALRRDSELHSAYALLADIYARKNKVQLALGQLRRAIESVPEEDSRTRSIYVIKRAALLRRDNQAAESLAALQGLGMDGGLRGLILRDMATSWMMLGKPEMAAELYEGVLRADPSSDLAAAGAAKWRMKVGDMDAARKHVQTLRRINPRHESLIELERELGKGDGVGVE
jgi:tetratricopeptide (TPR) repeat protein